VHHFPHFGETVHALKFDLGTLGIELDAAVIEACLVPSRYLGVA
jgi:hypothetical protein